jgi:hypothetical protein
LAALPARAFTPALKGGTLARIPVAQGAEIGVAAAGRRDAVRAWAVVLGQVVVDAAHLAVGEDACEVPSPTSANDPLAGHVLDVEQGEPARVLLDRFYQVQRLRNPGPIGLGSMMITPPASMNHFDPQLVDTPTARAAAAPFMPCRISSK